MPIIVRLDVALARRKMRLTELSEKVGISLTNLSALKNDARAIRFTTMSKICYVLNCKTEEILEYVRDSKDISKPAKLKTKQAKR